MEPREPMEQESFLEDFAYDVADYAPDMETLYSAVNDAVNDFYRLYSESRHDKNDFYELLNNITPARGMLHIEVAAREIAAAKKGIEISKPDTVVLHEAWFYSFMQCLMVAYIAKDLSADELRQVRDFAYEQLLDIHNSQHTTLSFEHYAAANSWYSHVAIGSSILLGETAEAASADWRAAVVDNVETRRKLERFEFAGHNLYKDKVDVYGATEKIRPAARYVTEGLEEDADAAARAFLDITYLNMIALELERCDEERTTRWRELVDMADSMPGLFDDEPDEAALEPDTVRLDSFKPMEVDWEVLPPGMLQNTAREIADGMNDLGKEVTIDPERLKALEMIRLEWGADRSFYAKGALRARQTRRNADKQCPDQFILLILQEEQPDGGTLEHAVAESPIAGEHAMYIFRQDVNPTMSWRDVMSVEKSKARTLGARPIKHPSLEDASQLPSVMAERAALLLAATPDEFLRLEFRGGNRYVVRQQLAIKAFNALVS